MKGLNSPRHYVHPFALAVHAETTCLCLAPLVVDSTPADSGYYLKDYKVNTLQNIYGNLIVTFLTVTEFALNRHCRCSSLGISLILCIMLLDMSLICDSTLSRVPAVSAVLLLHRMLTEQMLNSVHRSSIFFDFVQLVKW